MNTTSRRQLLGMIPVMAAAAAVPNIQAAEHPIQSTARPMRRKDRELTKEETIEIIKNTPHCLIATVDKSGTPYVTPITAVYFEGAVYFHSAADPNGRRYQNVLQNPKVSMAWVGRGETASDELPGEFSVNYASAIVEGEISRIKDEAEKKRIAAAFAQRHVPQAGKEGFEKYYAAMSKGIVFWKVKILSMSGKARNKQGYFNRIKAQHG